ncbi:MAG: alkaline phosphatase D family protein [Acidobacteria bacterium]|nr:alkaline phosphatase D family protein [Acidobacteriota bacterium]
MQRREFLGWAGAPAVLRGWSGTAQDEPLVVQSGDVVPGRGIVWARAGREARMVVRWRTTGRPVSETRKVRGPLVTAETGFTGRVDLSGLPAGQRILFEVQFETPGSKAVSRPVQGHFLTPPAGPADVRLLWSGDMAGQGWGINPDLGGIRIFEAMRKLEPHFFVHNGDTIYADNPVLPEVKLADGRIWKNITTEAKSKVAETLDEFRGCYRYNLLDENVRRFSAEVAQVWQWDDHEVINNWSPGLDLSGDRRYQVKDIRLLVDRARQAFLEYAPMRLKGPRIYRRIPYGPLLDVFVIDMRSYRGPNNWNRQQTESAETAYLGARQLDWLKREVKASRAVWKIIASDMPLGLIVPDGKDEQGRPKYENSANGDGPPLGRELEIAGLLKDWKQSDVRNTVWLTADVHYTAAHSYDPTKAQFTEFAPFWEFVSGPLNAGTFGPGRLDNTFGPQVVFQKAPPPGRFNLPPAEGYQFFGDVRISGKSRELTVTLRDLTGAALYSKTLSTEKS